MSHEEHSRRPSWLDGYDELLARVHVMRPWIGRADFSRIAVPTVTWVALRVRTKRARLREFWQRVLVALDARASDDETTALEMFNVNTGEAAIDINPAYTFGAADKPFTDRVRTGPAGTEACRRNKSKALRAYVCWEDSYDGEIYDDGREPTAEEKREQVRRIVRAQRKCPLFGPIAGIPWKLRYRNSTINLFDEILKEHYTDEAIENLAATDHPFFTMVKKETVSALRQAAKAINFGSYGGVSGPQVAYVNPETYKDLEKQLAPQKVWLGGGQTTVIPSESCPKDTAYLLTEIDGDLYTNAAGGLIKLTNGPGDK